MILGVTLLVIMLLIVKTVSRVKIHKSSINIAFYSINGVYRELFKVKDIKVKFLQVFMIILSEFFSFIIIYNLIMRYGYRYGENLGYYLKLLIIIAIFLVVHYAMGYIMLISSKMYSFIYRNEEESLKLDFLLSYFLTTAYLTVLLLCPSELYKYALVGVMGVAICYFLNIKILINVMKNPKGIKFSVNDSSSFSRVFFAAIFISIMIIINLYLAVCLAHIAGNGGFSNNPGYFDLFYYTIITFTTIGFGDIIPLTIGAKFIAILISLTSVMCLTVFLGSIFSYRDKEF